jgi:hypothetical protein
MQIIIMNLSLVEQSMSEEDQYLSRVKYNTSYS